MPVFALSFAPLPWYAANLVIKVVSAAEFAGEMGPIKHYVKPQAITGRAGFCPARMYSERRPRLKGAGW